MSGPITANVVAAIEKGAGLARGAIEMRTMPGETGRLAGIAYRCPCGCGTESWLPVGGTDGWQWDGNWSQPTLKPSVLHRPCGWHGYLTKGQWRAC